MHYILKKEEKNESVGLQSPRPDILPVFPLTPPLKRLVIRTHRIWFISSRNRGKYWPRVQRPCPAEVTQRHGEETTLNLISSSHLLMRVDVGVCCRKMGKAG